MRVKASQRAEKDLAADPECLAHADELGDLFQLVPEAGTWMQWERWDVRIAHQPERPLGFQRLPGHLASTPHERQMLVDVEYVPHSEIMQTC